MPEYPRPGVYVEVLRPEAARVPALTRSRLHIGRVERAGRTSRRWPAETTAALFIGFARVGPFGEPTAIRSWAEFDETFGGLVEGMWLGYAVYGFFANGGTLCHVVREDDLHDLSFSADLERWMDTSDVAVVCAPDLAGAQHAGRISAETTTAYLLWMATLCEYTGQAVAIVDTPPEATPQQAKDWRFSVGSVDSPAVAVYHPWLVVEDPVTMRRVPMPPSGHLAGVYANNDAVRGFHYAPSNEVVLNAEDVAYRTGVDEQQFLAMAGINSLVFSPGRGVVVWGARSASSEPEWRYLRRRRLLSFITRRIRAQTTWVVGERADLGRVRQNAALDIGDLLHLLWLSGAVWGDSPEDAYSVSLDEDAADATRFTIECVVAAERDLSLCFRVVYVCE